MTRQNGGSKAEIFSELIRNEIFKEVGKDGKLPAEIVLAQRYGASPITIGKALNILEAKGLLNRISRSGTYLNEDAANFKSSSLRMVGASMPFFLEGHVDLAAHMSHALQEEHYMPCLFDGRNTNALLAMLPEFLKSNPYGLIVNGDSKFPYQLLDEIGRNTRLVFASLFEGPRNYNASYILYDHKGSGALGVKHLLKAGRRKIGIVNFEMQPKWSSSLFWEGCKEAFQEAGADPVFHIEQLGSEMPANEVDSLLSGENRPDAIFGIHDSRLLPFIKSARRLGLRVPDDIAFIGGGNTDWAIKFDLTSLDSMDRELAIQSVAALASKAHTHCSILPRIIFRGSCLSQ